MKTKKLLFLCIFLSFNQIINAQPIPVKKVLLEEFTTVLCGMCPPKSKIIHDWYESHKAHSILIVHHAGFGVDAMTIPDATNICNGFDPGNGTGFAPAILIDRDFYPWVDTIPYMSVNGFDSIALRVSGNPTPVAVGIQGTYNSTTRQLNVTATATFSQSISGPMRLSLYLREDSVIGSGYPAYDQKCSSASWANQYYPGQYDPTTQHILGYPHMNVNRGSLIGGTWGPSGVIATSPAINTPYSTTVTYTIPSTFNDARLSLVAYVANYGSTKFDKNVLNAEEVKIAPTITTAINNLADNSSQINAIYPNPSQGSITMAFTLVNSGATTIKVTDFTGRTVSVLEEGAILNSGRYEASFNLGEIESGIYMVTVQNGTETVNSKLIVE